MIWGLKIYATMHAKLFFLEHVCNLCLIQIQARKMQERGWQPRWFQKDDDGSYRYKGGYWETREKNNWDGIPDIFGQSCDLPSCSEGNVS